MAVDLLLLPAPRRMTVQAGQFVLPAAGLVLLDDPRPQTLHSAGLRFLAALARINGLLWDLAAGAVPAAQVTLHLRVAPERVPQPQGYRLQVADSGLLVEGHDPAGLFYGVCTLIQLLEQAESGGLPCLTVQDWPDFPARGVMLDVSRDKVLTLDTLFELVDRLAGWKINQLQLYTEHTFAYRAHRVVWEHASPLTGQDILALGAYCRERFVELVPNQNSFGHLERWLPHAAYADLAETHGEIVTPWGHKMQGPFSLAPEHPGSLPLITGLYDELLPHFSSRMFNVGLDETIDLGQGASREICEARGTGRVYLDFLLKIYADVQRRGYTMQFWGDIITKHPELVPELPRDVIAMAWGYEIDHPYDEECALFAASGIPFYVCPGTATWCSLAGRTDNALGNLLNAAENGLKHGAIGFLNTDWGDRGHWQTPPVSYLGFAAGAGLSWALEANRSVEWAALVSRFAFEDPSGVMGRVAYDLGNIYQQPGFVPSNGSVLFWALQMPLDEVAAYGGSQPAGVSAALRQTLTAIDQVMAPLSSTRMARADADLICHEYENTARIMRHACRRALLAIEGASAVERAALAADLGEFLLEYRALWLARARPGGLDDSAARFERMLADYQ